VITSERVFEDGYLPRRLFHRDQEVGQLSREFEAIVDGDPGGDALISGPSGVGKTVLARHTLDRLETTANVAYTHLRCLGMTDVDILAALLEAVPGGPATVDRDRFTDAVDLRCQLDDVLKQSFVAILDEADAIAYTNAIDHFATVRNLSLVVICHDPTDWLARIGRDHRAQFDGDHHIRLERYRVDELLDILWIRAERGLRPDVITREQLRYIADEVAGVARYGIQTVHAAAEIATDRGHDVIRNADVDDAFPRAERRIRKANLLSLPFHHHFLYALIHDAGELPAHDLHARYEDVAEDCYYDRALEPIGARSRRNKLQKLAEYGLIEWSGEHQHRRYRLVDDTIAPPIDLQSLTNISGT
jgi:Cdc6-like AAA superfamily ATPase